MLSEKNKVIAFIPARGGSKGIKNKNTIDLGGIPLIMWSIFAAYASEKIDRIVVSSDSRDILFSASFHSRHLFQKVELLDRDQELALDSSTTESVITDFIKNDHSLNEDDVILLMQPTSPFRHGGLVDKVLDSFVSGDFSSCVTASERSPFFWKLYDIDGPARPLYDPKSRKRRQDMICGDYKFQEDGNLYGFTVSGYMQCKHRSPFRSCVVLSDHMQSIEIDNQLDLDLCRSVSSMEVIQEWKKSIVI
tara:strand:+ start:142 stop:888 length:747 start_codon:yes stop_codon:yes gene_type:complete